MSEKCNPHRLSMNAILLILSIIIATVSCITGCVSHAAINAEEQPQVETDVVVVDEIPEEEVHGITSEIYTALEAEYLSLTPSVPAYSIEPDLSNVVNLDVFADELSPEIIEMLARNGFAVKPSDAKQIYWIYEWNDYEKMPSFITTDSILHTYHLFFDYVLRTIETEKLIPALSQLNSAMVTSSNEVLAAADDPDIRDVALKNLAYFSVADYLLDGNTPQKSVEQIVLSEVERIEAHEERKDSVITGCLLDYTQFVPRGHYTRTEDLEKYFRAMMWYGLVGFPVRENSIQTAQQTLLMVHSLKSAMSGDISAVELWEIIYEPTAFFVGESDNFTFYEISTLMDEIYGPNPDIDEFADENKLNEFIDMVKNLPGPDIEQYVPLTEEQIDTEPLIVGVRQFQFMGQRFIPDSRILQELVHPKVNQRLFPSGLDVFAAMGSDRALDILETNYDVGNFTDYDSQMTKMRGEISATSIETWQSNLYYGWLWSLKSLITPVDDGYPGFMQTDAWQDKSLFTVLGSWTELRHDTVLYARQSAAESGDGEEEVAPLTSYVEPNVEFWTKIQWLTEYTEEGLASRDLINDLMLWEFERLDSLVTFLRSIAIKELSGESVTYEEYRNMEYYGGTLESMMLSIAGGDLINEADKDMALVVDVHTTGDIVLQEATGRVGFIYVIVPVDGELHLTRGGIFTQYEFTHPASDRLTDEKWREILDNNGQPPFAEWTGSFLLEE